jgi:hypothetical protein
MSSFDKGDAEKVPAGMRPGKNHNRRIDEMAKPSLSNCILTVLILGATLAAQAAKADARVWRAANGQTLQAEFVELKTGAVVLKGADGQLRPVPLNQLAVEDQAVVPPETPQESKLLSVV